MARSGSLFSFVDLESRVPSKHPLRVIKTIVDEVFVSLDAEFAKLYEGTGRHSIAPERLLRATLLQAFYSVRSERQLMEQIDHNLLFRWFVGLGIDDPVWDQSTSSKSRDRLLDADVAAKFLEAVLRHPKVSGSFRTIISQSTARWSTQQQGDCRRGRRLRGDGSACSRIGSERSSCRPIRCSWRKCATSSGFICRRPSAPWCCVSTRRARCRPPYRTQPLLPMRPGQAERRTHDYKRHRTTSLFAALDVKAGTIVGKCMPRHRAAKFRKFLDEVERNVPDGLDVHVVMDNYGTHKTKLIRAWFAKRPRWHVHFTPTSACGINQVERFFPLLTERALRRGVFRSVAELEKAIKAYIAATKSADDILASIQRFCLRTLAAKV